MIRSFTHKGVERFFLTGSKAGIQVIHSARRRLLLVTLDQAVVVDDMAAPGLRLHLIKGKKTAYWAVTVQANWRLLFKFDHGNATVLDYLDDH